jgi:hypothetical protein
MHPTFSGSSGPIENDSFRHGRARPGMTSFVREPHFIGCILSQTLGRTT